MAVDANDIIQLLRSNPEVRAAVFAIANEVIPRGAVVGAVSSVGLKGYAATSAPSYYYRKEG